jgi:hypothetical protein
VSNPVLSSSMIIGQTKVDSGDGFMGAFLLKIDCS